MTGLGLLFVGLFLPLFPLSIAFNAILERVGPPWARSVLLLAWPQFGLWVLSTQDVAIPSWFVLWALATALLYAFRLLAMRDMGRWIGYFATSAWTLLWLAVYAKLPSSQLWTFAAAFSVPLVFLTLQAGMLERRFGAAYIGLYRGLAQRMPRFSGVLVLSLLATIATPLFPTFFAMLHTLIVSQPLPAVGLAVIWLIWSWAAARLLQGLIVGPSEAGPELDLPIATTWGYAAGLAGLILAGLFLTGSRL